MRPNGFDFDALVIRDVARHFGRRRALVRVSFTCQAGEIVGLLGPNGAGKSTLLSIIATLLAPSAGEVRYGTATAIDAGAGLRGQIGVLAHDLLVYPELTARENLMFFARLYGITRPAAAVDAALERARLTGRDGEPVAGFSRGMRQRLALERALLHDPRLVLLDEPFTGLDDASTALLVARLRELKADGRIVLIATHDLEIAGDFVDRIVILKDGRSHGLDAWQDGLRTRYRAFVEGA